MFFFTWRNPSEEGELSHRTYYLFLLSLLYRAHAGVLEAMNPLRLSFLFHLRNVFLGPERLAATLSYPRLLARLNTMKITYFLRICKLQVIFILLSFGRNPSILCLQVVPDETAGVALREEHFSLPAFTHTPIKSTFSIIFSSRTLTLPAE